jgi:hypothetical protein
MTHEPEADELRIRELLRRRGVGPDAYPATNASSAAPSTPGPTTADDWWDRLYDGDGQALADPHPDNAPDPRPDAAPTPDGAARSPSGGRLPDWRTGQTIDLSPPAPDTPAPPTTPASTDSTAALDTPDTSDESEEPDTETTADSRPDTAPPRSRNPLRKVSTAAARKRRRTRMHSRNHAARPSNRRLRALVFNAAAASAGYAIGLVPLLASWLPSTGHSAAGVLALGCAGAGAVTGWTVFSRPAVTVIVPCPGAVRIIAAAAAAESGRRLAPKLTAFVDARTSGWGLGSESIALLLTSAVLCGGLWWLIDRRSARWHWTARLAARIPLASALLATALHAPGPA